MRIAVAGFGIEGQANYRYWSQDPQNNITIVDEKDLSDSGVLPTDVDTIFGADAFSRLDGFDMVIRTASLSPRKIKTDGTVWSATNEFFAKCPAKIIGVTGTKGKGTTSTIITAILEAAGKKVWLVGNIGNPSLDALKDISPDDLVVYELSSFQLWDLQRSPSVAVVIPVVAEHLDVHDNFNDYLSAKANIRRHQKDGDVCIYYDQNENAAEIAKVTECGAKVSYANPNNSRVYVADGYFKDGLNNLFPASTLNLPGEHNLQNACAAITVALYLDIDINHIEEGLKRAKGLPHRIQFIRTFNEVSYYNDSYSTSPVSALAAAKSFGQPEVLVLGGVDRGADFDWLASNLQDLTNIKEIVLYGAIKDKLKNIFNLYEVEGRNVTTTDASSMEDIVNYATQVAQPGGVIVFSPACASFDMFKDFKQRGDLFEKAVMSL